MDDLESHLLSIERANSGWVYAEHLKRNVNVFLDGHLLENVWALHRRKCAVRVFLKPYKLDKTGKRVLWKTFYGYIRIELKDIDND